MSIDVVDLRAFYSERLGTVARYFVGRGIRNLWGDTQGLRMVGMAATTTGGPTLGRFDGTRLFPKVRRR